MSNGSDIEDFDPYRIWLGIPKAEQPPNHYRLLGVTLFENDPQVIEEAADRQIAHLKTKQTGARVALSQKLLQQVTAAAGRLLDEAAKAKYDRKLRQALPAAEAPKPEAPQAPDAPLPLPVSAPPPMQPVYQQPSYSQPIYQQPAPYYPPPPQPLYPPAPAPYSRPLPLPTQPEPPPLVAEAEDDSRPQLSSLGIRSGRVKNSSGDLTKIAVAGTVALLMLLAAWGVLSRPGMFDSSRPGKSQAVVARTAIKPKAGSPKTKPQPPVEIAPVVVPEKPETPTPAESVPPITPSQPPAITPTPPATDPAPMPLPLPTTPMTTPSVPTVPTNPQPAAKTVEKKLWRYAGGFIEQGADGAWKELAPTGDYFTLTLITPATPALGGMGEMLEFERTSGRGRLRVSDNRLELADGAIGTFTEVAKGSWGLPADEIEMDSMQQGTLRRACQLYADELAKARQKLLKQFSDEMSYINKRIGKAEERLMAVAILEAEKQRFESEGLVPWSPPMQADTAKYISEINQARTASEALFERVINHFITRKDHETASSILALKQKTLAPLVIARMTKTDVPRPPNPFGFVRRRDNDAPDDDGTYNTDPRTGLLRLWSNGALNNIDGKSNWTIAGANLKLQFARTGYSIVDTIVINERGDELSGKTNFSSGFSLNFTGKFENTLEPHERRPVVKFNAKLKPVGAAEATPE